MPELEESVNFGFCDLLAQSEDIEEVFPKEMFLNTPNEDIGHLPFELFEFASIDFEDEEEEEETFYSGLSLLEEEESEEQELVHPVQTKSIELEADVHLIPDLMAKCEYQYIQTPELVALFGNGCFIVVPPGGDIDDEIEMWKDAPRESELIAII